MIYYYILYYIMLYYILFIFTAVTALRFPRLFHMLFIIPTNNRDANFYCLKYDMLFCFFYFTIFICCYLDLLFYFIILTFINVHVLYVLSAV